MRRWRPTKLNCDGQETNMRTVVSRDGRTAIMLGKPPVPGHLTNLDYSKARAYCACGNCGWGLLGHFLSSAIFSFFLPLTGRWPDIDRNTVSKGRYNENNQSTNQPNNQPTMRVSRGICTTYANRR